MKKFYSIILFHCLFPVILIAQDQDNHHSSGKEKGIYEIITSGIYVLPLGHEEGLAGTEVHLTYWLNHKWGGGISYATKFTEGQALHDIALLGSMNPTQWITLNAGLNIGLAGAHRELKLGAYTETEINIRPNKWFHFGPVLGAVFMRETEVNVGFHLGFEF